MKFYSDALGLTQVDRMKETPFLNPEPAFVQRPEDRTIIDDLAAAGRSQAKTKDQIAALDAEIAKHFRNQDRDKLVDAVLGLMDLWVGDALRRRNLFNRPRAPDLKAELLSVACMEGFEAIDRMLRNNRNMTPKHIRNSLKRAITAKLNVCLDEIDGDTVSSSERKDRRQKQKQYQRDGVGKPEIAASDSRPEDMPDAVGGAIPWSGLNSYDRVARRPEFSEYKPIDGLTCGHRRDNSYIYERFVWVMTYLARKHGSLDLRLLYQHLKDNHRDNKRIGYVPAGPQKKFRDDAIKLLGLIKNQEVKDFAESYLRRLRPDAGRNSQNSLTASKSMSIGNSKREGTAIQSDEPTANRLSGRRVVIDGPSSHSPHFDLIAEARKQAKALESELR